MSDCATCAELRRELDELLGEREADRQSAVEAERERCAKLVEATFQQPVWYLRNTGLSLADAIRSGLTKDEEM